MRWNIRIVLLLAFALLSCAAGKNETPKTAQSIGELRQQLEQILKDTHTPGVSVAIVHRDGPEWVAALGQADVATARPATPETLFRIGSISKGFTSLAILMLAGQGKLSLDDPVHKLAPEVWFENPWESTDPVRVVHLLEHTTGWDDMHLREFAKDWPGSMGLKEAFDFDHHSRISRWRPGTRMAYSNSGPPVAAYIVEKITHQRFEDFVAQNLFRPVGMNTATYFQPPPQSTTTLYHDDGSTPYPYWNILLRPAGSINASAKDMAAYLQFYLNRGANIVPSSAIDRMETPAATWASGAGLKFGYGLSNYWEVDDGFVYHGHDGGVDGGLSEMLYLPDYGVGYFYSINAGNGGAAERIGKAIRAYITRSLPKPPVPPAAPLPSNVADYAGFYERDSPRVAMFHFMDPAGITWIHFKNGKLISSNLGLHDEFLPVNGMQFRRLPDKDPPAPVASLVLLPLNREGRFISVEMETRKRIPAWLALPEIFLFAFVLLSAVSLLIYAPFWILGGLIPVLRRSAERAVRLLPLLSVLSFFAGVAGLIWDNGDGIARMGNLTVWSAALCLGTILFALFAIASAFAVARAKNIRGSVRRFSIVVTAALLIGAAYLAWWRIIGIRTWI